MPSPAGSGADFGVVQFRLSRAAADALELSTLRARGAAAGVADPRFEYNAKDVRRGGYRITCGRAMAVFIIGELKRLIATAEGPLVLDCGEGVMDALKAIAPPARSDGGTGDGAR